VAVDQHVCGLKIYDIDLPDAPPLVRIPSMKKKTTILQTEDDSLFKDQSTLTVWRKHMSPGNYGSPGNRANGIFSYPSQL